MNYDKVLVTGGTGLIGTALQEIKPDWIFLSSDDADLMSFSETSEILSHYKPDAVVHLAGLVGGIKLNINEGTRLYEDNVMINLNIVRACREQEIMRFLGCLSTCIWPEFIVGINKKTKSCWPRNYPFKEKDIFNGSPAPSNKGYAYAKRMMQVHVELCRNDGYEYNCFSPCNVYGPNDKFDEHNSHVVASLIRKFYEASKTGDKVEVWGDGTPMRQHIYSKDIARIIPLLLENHTGREPVIVTPNENLSIKHITRAVRNAVDCRTGKSLDYYFNNKMNGQLRKDGTNELLRQIIGDENCVFTPFWRGVKETVEWYIENETK